MPGKQRYLYQIPAIYEGLQSLLTGDPVFRALDIGPEHFKRPYDGPGFAGLVRIVIGQQVSTKAADALWQKFSAALPVITPQTVLALNPEQMRVLGLSRQKTGYIQNLAQSVDSGAFSPDTLEAMPDEDVYKAITALKGFGHWSAEMYLIFNLGRPDIWPAGDLGVQEGLRLYLKSDERPDTARTQKEGARFAPYRTAAALLLWHLKSKN